MELHITSAQGARDITQLVSTVKWSGDYQQAARTLEFDLIASATDETVPSVPCELGASAVLLHDTTVLFDGFVVNRTIRTGSSVMRVTCFDRGFYLKQNRELYKFTAMTPEAVTRKIAGDFGLATGSIAATGVQIDRTFITGAESLYDIIATVYTLAAQTTGEKYHIGFQGDKLCVTVKGPGGNALVIRGKSNLIEATRTESIEKLVNAVKIYDENENLVIPVEDSGLIRLYGRLQEVLRQDQKDDKTAQARKLLDDRGVEQKITVENLGDTANITGGSVIVKEPHTKLYGLFYIDSDTHEWKRGQYYNKLVLNFRNIMNEQQAGS